MITAGATPTPKTIDQRRVALTSPQVKTLQTDNAGTLGQHLLAHELSHVAQEPIPAVGGSVTIGRADDPVEGAADRSAGRVFSALRGQGQSRPDALTSPAEPDSTQVVRETATDPVPADGPGTVIRRTVC